MGALFVRFCFLAFLFHALIHALLYPTDCLGVSHIFHVFLLFDGTLLQDLVRPISASISAQLPLSLLIKKISHDTAMAAQAPETPDQQHLSKLLSSPSSDEGLPSPECHLESPELGIPTFDQARPAAALTASQDQTRKVGLQVGERHFTTRADTLVEKSGYFRSMLAGPWSSNDSVINGEIFIDGDGDVFEHALRYMRHGVLPVFYDISKGHDYARYLVLLEQARYFQLVSLEDWIEGKRYLNAVKVERWIEVLESPEDTIVETTNGNERVDDYPQWKTENVYVCPRGLAKHRGNPGGCGKACEKARGDAQWIFEDEEILKVVRKHEKVVFDHSVCRGGQ